MSNFLKQSYLDEHGNRFVRNDEYLDFDNDYRSDKFDLSCDCTEEIVCAYEFFMSAKERNKLQHSLNGNIDQHVPQRRAGQCFHCGLAGHIARNCGQRIQAQNGPRNFNRRDLVERAVHGEMDQVVGQLAAARAVNEELRQRLNIVAEPRRSRSRDRNGRNRENYQQAALRAMLPEELMHNEHPMLPPRPPANPDPPAGPAPPEVVPPAVEPPVQGPVVVIDRELEASVSSYVEMWRCSIIHTGVQTDFTVGARIPHDVEDERPIRHNYEARPVLHPDMRHAIVRTSRVWAIGAFRLLVWREFHYVVVSGGLIAELGSKAPDPQATMQHHRGRFTSDANRIPHLRADAQFMNDLNVIENSVSYLMCKLERGVRPLWNCQLVLANAIVPLALALCVYVGYDYLSQSGFYRAVRPRVWTLDAVKTGTFGQRRFSWQSFGDFFSHKKSTFAGLFRNGEGRKPIRAYGNSLMERLVPHQRTWTDRLLGRDGTRDWKSVTAGLRQKMMAYYAYVPKVNEVLGVVVDNIIPTVYCESKHTALPSIKIPQWLVLGVYGYRVVDFLFHGPLDVFPDSDGNVLKLFRFRMRKGVDRKINTRNPITGVNPFFYVEGVMMPACDPEPMNQLAGLVHRIARSPHPNIDASSIYDVGEWMVGVLPRFVDPIERPMRFLEYIEGRPWTEGKKKSFVELHEGRKRDYAMKHMDPVVWSCFTKFEFYPVPKNPRGIYAVGKQTYENDYLWEYSRYIKTIEKNTYPHLPGIIKMMTVQERAQAVRDWGDNAPMGGSDYSAFEASFSIFVLVYVMIPVLACMTRGDYTQKPFISAVWTMYTSKNLLEFSSFVACLVGCNTSGTSSTAYKNLMFNWGAWGYGMWKFYQMPPEVSFRMMYLEGDDNKNDLQAYPLPAVYFERLGLYTKMETWIPNPEMPFCQQYLCMLTDVSIKDPRVIIKGTKIKLMYCASRPIKMLELLRAQALSWYCEADGSPVVAVMARRIIHLTEGVFVKRRTLVGLIPYSLNVDEIELHPKKFKMITDEARDLVEKVFHFPVWAQKEVEQKIEEWSLGVLVLPLDLFPLSWLDFWATYVKPFSREYDFDYLECDQSRQQLVARLAMYSGPV